MYRQERKDRYYRWLMEGGAVVCRKKETESRAKLTTGAFLGYDS